MPNRILKESIRTSETINALTPEEETFFYRLLTCCDDYGRFDGRVEIIRAACFPLRLHIVTGAHVRRWLQRLVDVGLLRMYEVKGKPYLQVVTWDKHQQIRAKKSKYPAPESGSELMISNDIMCEQTQSSDGICPRESESESESEREIINTPSNDESANADGALFSTHAEETEQQVEAPNPGENTQEKTQEETKKPDLAKVVMDEYNRIFAGCWKRPLQLTPDRRAKIQARLKQFTVEDLVTAMINIRASPFHCGENDRGQVYATPEFIFRNDAQVDKWRNMEVRSNGRSSTPKSSPGKRGKWDEFVINSP